MSITRKTCLITGCSNGGAGAALAEAFINKGYHVFATARSPSKIPKSMHAASNVTVLALDVTSSESIAAAAEHVRSQTRERLDVLINNAGGGLSMPALDTPIAEARKLFELNFFGVLELIQVFSPMLINARGCIVNNSSIGCYHSIPFISMYSATKAALTRAGETLRLEMAPLGVRVITLITGGVATKFTTNIHTLPLPEHSYYLSIKDIIEDNPEEIPFGMKPEIYASSVLQRVEQGATGQVWVGGGVGFARPSLWLLPQFLLDRISLSFKPFTKRLAEDHKKLA